MEKSPEHDPTQTHTAPMDPQWDGCAECTGMSWWSQKKHTETILVCWHVAFYHVLSIATDVSWLWTTTAGDKTLTARCKASREAHNDEMNKQVQKRDYFTGLGCANILTVVCCPDIKRLEGRGIALLWQHIRFWIAVVQRIPGWFWMFWIVLNHFPMFSNPLLGWDRHFFSMSGWISNQFKSHSSSAAEEHDVEWQRRSLWRLAAWRGPQSIVASSHPSRPSWSKVGIPGIWLFRLDSMAMTLGFVCGFPWFWASCRLKMEAPRKAQLLDHWCFSQEVPETQKSERVWLNFPENGPLNSMVSWEINRNNMEYL